MSVTSHARFRKAAFPIAAIAMAGLALSGCASDGEDEEPTADGGNAEEAPADNGGADDGAAVEGCDYAPDYPDGPVELIVAWAAGGGTDSVARLVGEELSNALGVQVNVVNRTGGAGVVGHSAMAQADPDGQTLGLATVELDMMHWQGLTDLTYEDLTMVAQVNEDAAGLTVAEDAEWQDSQELLDWIEANPGELRVSGTGQGGIWHLAILGLLLDAGLPVDSINFIPSEGAAPALQELVAGGIDLSPAALGENLTMLESGRARALGVMGTEPDANFPDVPTVESQTGLDYSMGVWRGIVGPAGLDENITAELECHLEGIVNSDSFGEFMANAKLGVKYRNSEDFTAFVAEDDAAKGVVMEEAGLAG